MIFLRKDYTKPTPATHPKSTKLSREMRRLDGFFNQEATQLYRNLRSNVTPTDPALPPTQTTPEDSNTTHFDTTAINNAPSTESDITSITPTVTDKALLMVFPIPRERIFSLVTQSNPFNVPLTQLKDILLTPSNFEEAYFHSDHWCRYKWREAIKLELNKMEAYSVWHPINRNEIPTNRKPIKNKWVFDIKRNGTFRARLVACGYSQIPGVDFQSYYSPVVNDAVFRIVIIIQLVWNLPSIILDVETAFLHGHLDETIYMLPPKGLNLPSTQCLQLDKALYGLVQAARQFYIKFSSVLTTIGFTVSYADPCLFFRNNHLGRIILIVHIDDCYVVGDTVALKHLVQEIYEQGLKTKVSPASSDYLSCDIKIDHDKKIAWIGQTTLMRKLIRKFKDKVNNKYKYKTPGTPGQTVERPSDDDQNNKTILPPEKQTEYRSGVGTLIQFANKTRPDLANPVRELAKCMDKATYAGYKEMMRIIKHLMDTCDYGLKLQPILLKDGRWELRIYTDSDWASDRNTRKSVTGFAIFFQGALVMWKSQSQRAVSLSSSEAEYYAISEATKEIKFIVQVIESLGMEVQKPIIVHVDNVGAIFIAETPSATKHTKHIDARYHFIREYIVDGVIQIIFVTSKENKADMFTKNVTSEIYDAHIDNFIAKHQIIETTTEELNKYKFFDSGGVLEMSEIPLREPSGIKSNDESNNLSSHDKRLDRIIQYLNGCNKPGKYKRSNIQTDVEYVEPDASGMMHDESNEPDPKDLKSMSKSLT
jgi:Reverse transcriptase (RNA-dependent DNA polymerase)